MADSEVIVHFDDHTDEAIEGLRAGVKAALSTASIIVQNNIKLKAPVDTGRLRASIQELDKDDDTVHVGTHVEYAGYLEFGTGLYHEPDPHSPWRIGSGPYRGAWVKGARSQPFMRPGLMAARPELPAMVAEVIAVALRSALPQSR